MPECHKGQLSPKNSEKDLPSLIFWNVFTYAFTQEFHEAEEHDHANCMSDQIEIPKRDLVCAN
jgi:hypothetical protein